MKRIPQDHVRLGALEVDLASGRLRNGDGIVHSLPDQPLQLLRMLVEADGQVVTREQIQNRLWPTGTVVEFDSGINSVVKKLRRALGDSAEEPRYIETLSKRGYRLQVLVERLAAEAEPESSIASAELSQNDVPVVSRRTWFLAAATACIVVIAVVGGIFWYWRFRREVPRQEVVFLGHFDNETGDSVFDDTLRQALAVQLGQSPFLSLVSEQQSSRVMSEMGLHNGDHLTRELNREVCLRTNGNVLVTGRITVIGSQYVIGVTAEDCNTANVLGTVQERADKKEAVLEALDAGAASLRNKLGESLSSIAKYDTPLQEATTPSLQALQAYTMAQKIKLLEGDAAAIPLFNLAIKADPNFAIVYEELAAAYSDLYQNEQSMKYARKAYDLRDRVSEKERLEIEAGYYLNYTAELEKAAEAYQQLQALYPRSGWYDNEIFIDGTLGNWDQALQLYQEQKRLRPDESPPDINITSVYLALNRFDEAGALLQRAHERGIMHQVVLGNRYLLAFLKGDTPQMQQAAAAAAGKPGAEDLLLMLQGETAAWFGRRREARLFAQHAMDVAQRNRATETASLYRAAAGLDEVMRGNYQQARTDVADALKLSATAETEEICALTLALAGDSAGAQELAAQLDEKHPLDTMVQKYWLPTIKGAVAMRKKDPALTVELLKAASPVELGAPSSVTVSLLPVFVRGEAYLALGQGYEATQEFQKFIDHRGLVANFPAGALARLGLARGLALEAGADPTAREKARSAFRDFLNLWQEADPDLPIYRQAKTEYAKLQ